MQAPPVNLSRWYGLTTRLAAREVALRYRGSLGGLGWMLLAPLLLLLILKIPEYKGRIEVILKHYPLQHIADALVEI